MKSNNWAFEIKQFRIWIERYVLKIIYHSKICIVILEIHHNLHIRCDIIKKRQWIVDNRKVVVI